MLHLYNSLSRKKELFTPQHDNVVRMYSCGPTVYDYPHIGNLRTYLMVDTLKRYLLYKGFSVNHVMNITDVGHLTSDADEGEDKLEKGATREGKTVWEVAQFYTDIFKENVAALNILPPDVLAKATDHIEDQIALIKRLEEKGFTYDTPEAVYFEVTKFPNYTKLSGQPLEEKIVGARQEVHTGEHKRHPQDFALWFKSVGKFAHHAMHWPSPWGAGFPGWHIECSAMSMKYLGESFDIHTGGIDHIPVHHSNEIAQSQAASGKPLANFWIHGEFLSIDGKKMSKSTGTFITLDDLRKKDFDPLAFRLLVLQAHYRSKLNFTWKSLGAAQESLSRVRNLLKNLLITSEKPVDNLAPFISALDDDLNTSRALSIFFEQLSHIGDENFDQTQLHAILLDMDKVFGLGLAEIEAEVIPKEVIKLAVKRETARKENRFTDADTLREEIKKLGYIVEDTPKGFVIKKQ